jgi:putative transposase
MEAILDLSATVGTRKSCEALAVPRSSYYRALRPARERVAPTRSPRSLSESEKAVVRTTLNSERFADEPPRQVYATLLDEGRYLCHWRTMYRILDAKSQIRERRNQLRHPAYEKPELLATSPNHLWSWDISKMRGPEKWSYYSLYVIMDVFSRYVVGWMVAGAERASLAGELIEKTCQRQGIDRDHLTIHADRGSPMTSKTVSQLLVDLGVEKTHSRPHVSNDNPFSEAQFKTMKYRPDYPKRFGSMADARAWARRFFFWYNQVHHHSALGLMPPAAVHHGRGEQIREQRGVVLQTAYRTHPERFPGGLPKVLPLPVAVWINKPADTGDGSVATEAVGLTASQPTMETVPEPEVIP